MMRSPSQCPGTARSATSAGRSLIISSAVTWAPGLARARPAGHAGRVRCAGRRRASRLSESPWESWRLLTLETRMESCHERCRREADHAPVLRGGEKAAAVRMVRALRAEPRDRARDGPAGRHALWDTGTESVRLWVRQADIDEGHVPGVTTAESARMREPGAGEPRLRRANEILKRAASFFGAEPSTANTRGSRVHRREPSRYRCRAHLQRAAGGTEHVLRGQDARPVDADGPRRRAAPACRAALGGQLLRLRGPQCPGRPPAAWSSAASGSVTRWGG